MANVQNNLVGINLATAALLADALGRAARDLEDGAWRVGAACVTSGVAATPVAGLLQIARWAEAEQRAVRAVVARLGVVDGGRVARWTGGAGPAYADPVAAVRDARLAAAALRDGEVERAATLLARHEGDPVFATMLVGGLGADGIVALLRPALELWERRPVVAAVGAMLAQAGRHGTSGVSVEDLAQRARMTGTPLAALALLFVGGARFPTEMVRDAVHLVVEPLNRAVLREPGLGVDPWLIPAGGAPLDARVVVLEAAARDRRAAAEALGRADLDALLAGGCSYADGGVALARLLLAGTTPLDHRGVPWTDPLVSDTPVPIATAGYNARRVIEWIGRHQQVPLAVHAELGRLARPWIGSFRSAGLDQVVDQHLALDGDLARGYLAYAQARDGVAEQLREAAWDWGAAELDALARRPVLGAGFDAVGSVLGIVTVTGLDAEASAAADQDVRTARHNDLWRRAVGLVLRRLPGDVRHLVLGRLLPSTDAELRHWRDLRDTAVAHEYLALDYLAAATLWDRRAENGYFDGRPPPPSLLIDPARPDLGLRPPASLDETGVADWTGWRARLASGRPAPLQLAGDALLAETRS